MPLVIALTSAATFLSAGSVAVTRGGGVSTPAQRRPIASAKPVSIEALIPRNAVAFARVTVNPSADQAAAIERLLRNIPGADRSSALTVLDRQLASTLPASVDVGAIRASLGEQMAMVVHVVDSKPQVVSIFETKDPSKARRGISESLGRGHVLVMDGNVAYAGSARAIAKVRAAAELSSMATHATYLRELGALGGSGLAVAWFDGSRLVGVGQRDLPSFFMPQTGPTGVVPDIRKSSAVAAAFIDGSTLVFEMRERGGLTPWFRGASNAMRLLGNGPRDPLLAMSMTDPATYLRTVLKEMSGGDSGPMPPGFDLEEDVFSWLGNEIAFFLLPEGGMAFAVAIKDEAAFDRAFAKMKVLAGAFGSIDGDAQGFSMGAAGRSVAMRRAKGAVYVALGSDQVSSTSTATEMVKGGGELARSSAYRSVFGSGPATIRVFAGGKQISGLFSWFDENPRSFLRHIRSVGYELRMAGPLSLTRVAVSFAG